ncbi:hypothetical protein AALA61_07150 [Oscillospiraceae bacterium 42-9]
MRESVVLLLLGGALGLVFLGFLGWVLEAAESERKRPSTSPPKGRRPWASEEELNEKVLRWVNKDARARADRRRRTW